MSREVYYPSVWPRYVIVAAISGALLVGAHLALTGFAAWALRLQPPAVRHALSFPYLRVIPILARCVGPAMSPAGRHSAQERAYCRRWWDAAGWYLERKAPDYLGGAMVAGALLAGLAYAEMRRRLRVPPSESQATSRWSSEADLVPYSVRKTPAARPEAGAMPMGTTLRGAGTKRPVELGLPLEQRFQHVWVLGVTGAGKTSSGFKRWLAADAALDGTEGRPAMSSVVVDVKHPDIIQFLWPVVAGRKRRLYVWAPFDPPQSTMRFNFLDYVPDPMDPATAAALILSNTPDYPRRDPFWKGMERQLLTLLIQMVTEEPPEAFASDAIQDKVRHVLQMQEGDPLPPPKSLPFVLVLSHLSSDEFVRMFELWPEPSRSKWRDRFATILSADERTLVGAMLGIQQALSVFAEREVVQSTAYSNFRLETIALQPTTLVIGLPTQPRENRQILTSLFIRQLLDVLGKIGEKRRPSGLPVPVTLYLDEIGTLGYIGNLPEYVATYRDLKVSFVLATQDTEQLTSLFDREQAEVLIANLHTRVVFGYDLRPEQAARISRDLGEKTIVEPSAEYKGGFLSQRRSGARLLVSTRPLLTPDEMRNMKPFEAVVVLPGNRKAMVYMRPVHDDQSLPAPLPKAPGWVHLYARELELDDVMPSPPAPERVTPPAPPPSEPRAMPQPAHLEAVAVRHGPADAPTLQIQTPEPDLLEPPPQQDAPGSRQQDGSAPNGQGQAATGSAAAASRASTGASDGRQGDPPIDLSEGHLVAFFRALLAGRLTDQRVEDGTPGYVYADRRGEALVPFGYFMDFGRKARLQFVDLNTRWIAEGLLGPRVSVIVDGKAVNCLNFTRQACRMLPPDLQAEVSRRFRRITPDSVRVHGHAPRQEADRRRDASGDSAGSTAAGRGQRTRPSSGQTPTPARDDTPGEGDQDSSEEAARAIAALPFLAECLDLVRQNVERFEGHPDYTGEGDQPMGRWRHVTRSGEELLLVRRDVLAGHIDALGGRPETVFALWRTALVLRGESDDRTVYRLDRSGAVYLAFRWQVLRQIGFPGRVAPDEQDAADLGESPYGG